MSVNVDELVQGDEIMLQGVEDRETGALAKAVRRAVDAANRTDADETAGVPNVSQRQAEVVASHIPLDQAGDEATAGAADASPCPRCGQAVPVTVGDRQVGDQLAVGELSCPDCGARLVRDVQGHADRGWRLAD